MGLRSLHQKTQNKHNEENDDIGADVQAEAGKSLASTYWGFSTGTFGHTDLRVHPQFTGVEPGQAEDELSLEQDQSTPTWLPSGRQ